MYRTVRISEILHQIKCPVVIEPDQEYSLLTVKLHHKGVVLRETKKGSLIGSKMYRVSAGQLILSGIDARNGAFGIIPKELDGAIVTNDFWILDFDEKIIKREFFYWLTNTPLFLNVCIKASRGETQRIRLQKSLFFNHELQIPPIEHQERFLERIQSVSSLLEELNHELDTQYGHIVSLRKSILQEAIEGKLTAKWRRDHPALISGNNHASKLLEKIKAEKERIINDDKKKRGKFLPILNNKKPFDLPEGWVWCKLGEIIIYTDNLDIHSKLEPDTLINYVDIDSIDNKNHKIGQIKTKKVSELSSRARRVLKKGYMVYSTVRPYLENIAFVEEDVDNLIGSTGFNVFKTVYINQEFIFYLLLSPYINELYKEIMVGFNSPSITNEQFENTIVPIPPIEEELAIVDNIKTLMATIEELRKQVLERKELSENLMQSVLREAFTTN